MKPYKFLILTGICSILLTGCGSKRQELSDGPDDAASTGKMGFAADMLPGEYLMKQNLTDSIERIMAASETYPASMDGPHNTAAQLGIIADHMDLWFAEPDFANDRYCYAVTDLNFDDRLELIVANCGGTGCYTYSSVYEVNESFNGLTKCETGYREGESQPDIIEESFSVFCDDEGVCHYIVNDYLKVSMAEIYLIDYALTLQNGKITNQPLRCMETIYNEGQESITYTDGTGNGISEEEYLNVFKKAFAGLTSDTVSFGWQNAAELKGKSCEEVIEKLNESFNRFRM